MNINKQLNRILTLGVAAAALGMTPAAFAAHDPSMLFTEGNVTCRDYASNKDINTISVGNPDLSGNPATADDGEVEVTYTITTDATGQQTLEFSDAMTLGDPAEDAGINLVVMKGDGNNVVVFVWGTDAGQTFWPSGSSEVSLTFGDPQTISAVSFCYGLGLEEPEVIPPLPLCEEFGDADACESGESFECDITGTTANCCACDESFASGCEVGGVGPDACGSITLDNFGSLFLIEGSSCICRSTSRGTRCWGDC